MLLVPYVEPPDGMACALACHTMTAQFFFPETSLDDLKKIVGWNPGYVVWGFKFWLWLMDRGIKITEYDVIDYEAWAKIGVEGLRQSVTKKEFSFYQKWTKDLAGFSADIERVFSHPNFTFHHRAATFEDLLREYEKGKLCELALNALALDRFPGFALHRVVVLEATVDQVCVHDPRPKRASFPHRQVQTNLFKKAWLKTVDGPELCAYAK